HRKKRIYLHLGSHDFRNHKVAIYKMNDNQCYNHEKHMGQRRGCKGNERNHQHGSKNPYIRQYVDDTGNQRQHKTIFHTYDTLSDKRHGRHTKQLQNRACKILFQHILYLMGYFKDNSLMLRLIQQEKETQDRSSTQKKEEGI